MRFLLSNIGAGNLHIFRITGELNMNRVLAFVLGVIGLIGILTALSFTIQQGLGHYSFRMGFPDSWIVWEEEDQKGFHWEMNLLRWSFGILVLSLFCLQYAVRLGWLRASKPSNSDSNNPSL